MPDTFAARLIAARRRAGLTLTALAEKCGLSRQQLSKYENGHAEPSISTLTRLVAALGCPVADLVPTTRMT